MYGFTARSSVRPSSTMFLINKINTLLRQIQMCFIIANRLEIMSVLFLMFLFQDDVFRILYHGGLHTKFYIIAIQGVDQANQIMCLFMKKQGQRLKYISFTKRYNIKIVFYITLVPTQTAIIYREICLALKILRVHHLHGLH